VLIIKDLKFLVTLREGVIDSENFVDTLKKDKDIWIGGVRILNFVY
jgi:hypothetical protein